MNFRWVSIIFCALILTINPGCEKSEVLAETIVYGHAGTTISPERWVYPANTRESILYALDVLDADGIEADIQMTKDSVLVLYHDPFLDENTKLSGCISQYNLADLTDLDLYQTQYELATLEDALAICVERNKKIFLDLKPYNYCDSVNVDYAVFNRSLNRVLENYSSTQNQSIVANAMNLYLLSAISDTNLVKSFETEKIQLAVDKFNAGVIDEVCINAAYLNDQTVKLFNETGIKFSVFGIKTANEIERAISFLPYRMITDNIAYTRKKTN